MMHLLPEWVCEIGGALRVRRRLGLSHWAAVSVRGMRIVRLPRGRPAIFARAGPDDGRP